MEREDLLKILTGDINLINSVNINDVALPEDEVVVMPFHVKKMLHEYLSGRISSEDLTRWAFFITMRAEYCCINYLDFEIADYYEDMFYVIQRLSTPQLDGEVNEARVKSYLSELTKYF